jgi:hypothetical protein
MVPVEKAKEGLTGIVVDEMDEISGRSRRKVADLLTREARKWI